MATKNLGRIVGLSAYEIWLEKGNIGTEEEFLNSLKGKDYVLTEEDKQEISNNINANIPKKVSELENDKNYLSSIPLEYVTDNELSAKGYATESFVSKKIAEAELSGGDVDLSGLATKDELASKVDKVKGKSLIDDTEISRLKNVTNYDDTEIKNTLNTKANTSAIPTKTSQLENDSGFLTEIELTPEQLDNITEAVVESQTKEFVDSIEECVDTKKQYVLPDGYIYAYKLTEVEVGGYTNVIDIASDDFKQNSRLNANCAITSSSVAGAFVSNVFDCKAGDVLRIKGITGTDSSTATAPGFVVARLNESGANITSINNQAFLKEHAGVATVDGQKCWNAYTTDENGVITWTYAINNGGTNFADLQGQSGAVKARIAGIATDGLENIIVTVNEEIKEPTIVKEYAWVNTGVSFVPTDNEERIVALETDVTTLKKDVNDLKQNGTGGGTAVVTSDVNWFAFGDSITQGYVSYIKEDGTASSRYSPAGKQSWVYKVAELNGYNVTNYAVGGTGLAYGNPNATTTARNQVDEVAETVGFANCDLVTLAWGCNDWKYNGGPVGSVDDDKDTDTTPCAALKYVIEKIQSQNPLCKIIVLTPINVCFWGTFEGNYGLSHSFSKTGTLEEFYNTIVSVCKYYGIEYIDNTHSSIFNRANITSLLLDGVHPTPEAYVVMGKELAKKINLK